MTWSDWRSRAAVAGLYAGGFLGPFGGALTTSILPEVGADFGQSGAAAAATVTAYLLPFAALMLVSGTFGAQWGALRTVRIAYLAYVVASVLCVVAWTFPVLLAGRALQGAANAFTTPLLLATIAVITPRERLGRALGLFASMQAAGQTSAPLLGGVAAEASWRWAFVGAAVVAALLAWNGLPASPPPPAERPSLRSAWSPSVLRVAGVGLIGWGCLGGLSFLVAFRLGDDFGLGASERGLVLTGFGAAGMLTARLVGRMIDRVGPRLTVLITACVGALFVAAVGLLPSLLAVGLVWALTGACSQGVVVGLNAIVLTGAGANQSGAVSVVQSLRFLGAAAAPLAFVPLYHASPRLAFLVPAGLLLLAAPAVLQRKQASEHV